MQSTVILPSRLTRDPELRVTPNGKSVCTLGVACDYGWGDRAEPVFIDVVCFDKTADYVSKTARKGDFAHIVGRLKLNQWESNTGEKRSKLQVIANEINLLNTRSSDRQTTANQSEPRAEFKRRIDKSEPRQPDAFDDNYDDDIPF